MSSKRSSKLARAPTTHQGDPGARGLARQPGVVVPNARALGDAVAAYAGTLWAHRLRRHGHRIVRRHVAQRHVTHQEAAQDSRHQLETHRSAHPARHGRP
eukprot:1704771-Prymnesium_polylepis.1